ncbi:MAG: GTPase ObgE [Bacteroidota bacterium]
MSETNQFVDYVRIYFQSGKGGNGVVSWRKEAFVPKGGPDGGDGGNGGSIILKGNPQLWTLLDLKYRKFIKAEHGENGKGQKKTGKTGADEILEVPLGTVIKNEETGEFLGEITEAGQELVLLEGGRGGKGNWQFRSPTNQAPDFAIPGQPSQELTAILELKVLADVGLVGFPNAGKSTLLSVVSEAKPKIGDYPFTTLVPNLGLVRYRGDRSFVVADIPGIIEDAHQGKGLGIRFLRHIERNSVLLFMVPIDVDNIREQYDILLGELKAYNPDLLKTPRMLAITKCDLADEEYIELILPEIQDLESVFISAVAQKNLNPLKDRLWQLMNEGDHT